jgi:hypothetical protein
MQTFAFSHGYELVALALPEGDSKDVRFNKVDLIRRVFLDGADEVLWVDVDALMRRPHDDEDPADALSDDDFQGLVLEHVPALNRLIPNTGVWYLRKLGTLTLSFLYDVVTLGLQPGPLADGGAVAAALNWRRGDQNYDGAKPGKGNVYTDRTCWMSQSWNQQYISDPPLPHQAGMSVVPDPHILHFAGLRNAVRERLMQDELDRLGVLV